MQLLVYHCAFSIQFVQDEPSVITDWRRMDRACTHVLWTTQCTSGSLSHECSPTSTLLGLKLQCTVSNMLALNAKIDSNFCISYLKTHWTWLNLFMLPKRTNWEMEASHIILANLKLSSDLLCHYWHTDSRKFRGQSEQTHHVKSNSCQINSTPHFIDYEHAANIQGLLSGGQNKRRTKTTTYYIECRKLTLATVDS